MKRVYKRWLEVVIVVGVLCILFSISLPSFFRNQQTKTNAKIFEGMVQILNAIQLYQNEYQRYPAALSEGQQHQIWNREGMYLYNNLNYDYLHSFLSRAKPDGLELSNEFEDLQYSQNFSLDAISVFRHSTTTSTVVAIVANQFNRPPSSLMLVDVEHFSPGEPVIQSKYFYAPSNGITSQGSLYIDIFGNHSPWIHEPITSLLINKF